MKRVLYLGLMVVLLAGLLSCAKSMHTEENESQPLATFVTALFDPSAGIIPFPNDLLMDRATGTVNIPNPTGLGEMVTLRT